MLDGREAMRLSVSLKAVVYFDLFQFTLPRRERQLDTGTYIITETFQSTLPRRERRDFEQGFQGIEIFQSTLP